MAITKRALALASRWFDEATVRRTFEPLIADWQREWQDASGTRRLRVSLRGVLAFISTVVLSSPRVLLEPTPSTVTNRVVSRIARFTLIAAAILAIPFAMNAQPLWLRGLLVLFVIPSSLTVAFPFAMIAAVDAIRSDHALPKHVERAAVAKLALAAVLLMIAFIGWIVPASNQVYRTTMTPAGMQTPSPGIREMNITGLITDPSRASAVDRTNAWGRAAAIRRELNSRASLALLPVFLLWLRWRMLDLPRRRWSPLPSWLMTPLVIAAFFVMNFIGINFARSAAAGAAVGVWLPTLVFIAVGLIVRWWPRPPLIQQEAP